LAGNAGQRPRLLALQSHYRDRNFRQAATRGSSRTFSAQGLPPAFARPLLSGSVPPVLFLDHRHCQHSILSGCYYNQVMIGCQQRCGMFRTTAASLDAVRKVILVSHRVDGTFPVTVHHLVMSLQKLRRLLRRGKQTPFLCLFIGRRRRRTTIPVVPARFPAVSPLLGSRHILTPPPEIHHRRFQR
jgi:hypothetical protein